MQFFLQRSECLFFKKLMPSISFFKKGGGRKGLMRKGVTTAIRPRCLSRFSGCRQGWLGLRGAEPTVTRPCSARHCGELGPASEVVGSEVGAAVCFLVVSNSRVLISPRHPFPDKRRGGGTAAAAAAAVASDTLLSTLQRIGSSSPSLSLFVVCLMC